jgi:hypothetical protein
MSLEPQPVTKSIIDKKTSLREQTLIDELRATFLQLTQIQNKSQGEKRWLDNVNRLNDLVISEDPRGFLQWDVISRTMEVGDADYLEIELNFLKILPNWERWEQAIRETPIGQPTLSSIYPASSGNLIHHAYHIGQFEEKTGTKIEDLDFIFEFGGGYGGMYRLIHNLGFQGKYVIFDFPAFSALQQYFIKSIGLEVHTVDSFKSAKTGVLCISDVGYLKKLLSNNKSADNSLFIATWSISEAPIDFRTPILSLINDFKAYLIAYQGWFEGNDNLNYFENWKAEQTEVIWHHSKIEHIPNSYYRDNYYLLGQKRL